MSEGLSADLPLSSVAEDIWLGEGPSGQLFLEEDAMKRILMPLPDEDFDPTETSIPWSMLTEAGHEVVFATQAAKRPQADPMMLSGEGLDPWGFIPGLRKLRVVGLALRAQQGARDAHDRMQLDASFRSPLPFEEVDIAAFDGLLIPGGHGPGMVPYLENDTLQAIIAEFFESGINADSTTSTPSGDSIHEDSQGPKAIGAICHGVVLAARATSPTTGRSVLHGRKTTALTWRQEKLAWQLTKYFARFWDPDYYRTYSEQAGEPEGYRGVEAEVTRALAAKSDFIDVTKGLPNYEAKTNDRRRDSRYDSRPAFVVRDKNYVSARWPGDVHTFAKEFIKILDDRS